MRHIDRLEPRSLLSNFTPPAGASIINVTASPYNATPNDATDDTAAIQAAIRAALDSTTRYSKPKFIYIPDGTYRISNTLESKGTDTSWSYGWRAGMLLMGQSRNGTILKLVDNATGFTSASTPKAVIKTGSENGTSDGAGNQGFRHSVMNLTVDTGTGNNGAIGIDYVASNRGAIENVTVKSTSGFGADGIRLTRSPGPALIKNVSITGFDNGIRGGAFDYSMTLENISLSGQKVKGIYTNGQPLFIRKLTSNNSVQAIHINGGSIVLHEATFTGGASGTAGAYVQSGSFLVRNLSSSGYSTVIDSAVGTSTDVAASGSPTLVAEYVTHAVTSLNPSPAQTLNIAIEETPEFYTTDMTQWANVETYGATKDNSSNDDAPAIQAAIDAGKEVVYLPNGDYQIATNVIVRGNVRKIIGLQSAISQKSGTTAKIVFQGTGNSILEHLYVNAPIEHNGGGTFTLRHVDAEKGVSTTTTASGKLFLEDVIGKFVFNGKTRIWGRQVNAESASGVNIQNNGNTVWLLGLKHERDQTLIYNNRGMVEVLGAFIYDYGTFNNPLFVNDEGSMVVSKVGHYDFPVFMREIRDGITTTVSQSSANYYVPLYVGYKSYTKRTGTVIGTAGSYNNNGNTRDKAHDGNLSTFFDAPVASGGWTGLDLGSAHTITRIRYAPRVGWANRMIGGLVQASNTADFSSGVVNLYGITTAPTPNAYTLVPVVATGTYRYVRYLSPANGFCNIAELEVYGNPAAAMAASTAPVLTSPTSPTSQRSTGRVGSSVLGIDAPHSPAKSIRTPSDRPTANVP